MRNFYQKLEIFHVLHLDLMQSPFGIKVLAKLLPEKWKLAKRPARIQKEPKLVENYHVWGLFTKIVTLKVLFLKQQLGLSCLKKPFALLPSH